MAKNKVALTEIPGMIFRAISLLFGTFLGYNFAIALALIIATGGIILVEKVFSAYNLSVVAVFQSWLEWGVQHFFVCLPILVVTYIAGWFRFIYKFVMIVAQDMKED